MTPRKNINFREFVLHKSLIENRIKINRYLYESYTTTVQFDLLPKIYQYIYKHLSPYDKELIDNPSTKIFYINRIYNDYFNTNKFIYILTKIKKK